jgi:hypothetical protein
MISSLHSLSVVCFAIWGLPIPLKSPGILIQSVGALIYYIRRCLHDWSDPKALQIFSIIAAAMKPGVSRLLIAEEIVPASHVDVETTWADLILMTLAGRVRTEEHWARVLNQAGMRLEKVHRSRGTNYGVVEAWLK